MESRMQHISKQTTMQCNQLTSVSDTSLQYKVTQSANESAKSEDVLQKDTISYPWKEKLIEATLSPSPQYGINPVDNPWDII
jgi:hypothetical protein